MVEDPKEIEKVRSNLAGWLAAFNEKNLEKLFSYYHLESLYANANAPLLRGVAQIKPWYENMLKTFSGTLEYQEEAAIQEGSLAMLLGAYFFRPPNGETVSVDPTTTGRVCLIYRKNERGNWKLIFDMDNNPPDIVPDQFD
ncbi:MAG: nuclear transport factor 2 family protein [Pseudomonadota bacterium]